MDALIMAGGKGRRMGGVEKPLVKIGDKYLIDHVLIPIINSNIEKIYVAVSPNTPKTRCYVNKTYKKTYKECIKPVNVIETSGKGYIEDLNEAMQYFSEPFLVVVSDIVNLTSKIINRIIDYFYLIKSKNPDIEALSVMIPKEIYPNPSLEFKGLVPAGINIVSPKYGEQKEEIFVIDELLFNVNTRDDLIFAENLLNQKNK
ncbi:MAG: TIGR00454 family protein [Methanococci archaeon]|nr:TIGR00454 family protein [Methanococci archaeon]